MSIVNTGITRIAAYDALKVIALVTMFIDHATAIFLPEGTAAYFIGRGYRPGSLPFVCLSTYCWVSLYEKSFEILIKICGACFHF